MYYTYEYILYYILAYSTQWGCLTWKKNGPQQFSTSSHKRRTVRKEKLL